MWVNEFNLLLGRRRGVIVVYFVAVQVFIVELSLLLGVI